MSHKSDTNDMGPYACSECDSVFTRKWSCGRHIYSQHGRNGLILDSNGIPVDFGAGFQAKKSNTPISPEILYFEEFIREMARLDAQNAFNNSENNIQLIAKRKLVLGAYKDVLEGKGALSDVLDKLFQVEIVKMIKSTLSNAASPPEPKSDKDKPNQQQSTEDSCRTMDEKSQLNNNSKTEKKKISEISINESAIREMRLEWSKLNERERKERLWAVLYEMKRQSEPGFQKKYRALKKNEFKL